MTSCDVLVVGAGPAGMAAAAAAAENGCRVLMADENAAPGGQIWRGEASCRVEPRSHARPYARLMRKLSAAGVQVLAGTHVVDQPAPGVLRVETETGCSDIRYQQLILATGAREHFLPFPGWTLPGVLGAGGLQALVKAGLPIAGKRVVLAGTGPLLLAVAANLARHSAQIAGVFEQAQIAPLLSFAARLRRHPAKLIEGVRYRAAILGVPYRTDAWAQRAEGEPWLSRVTVRVGRSTREIACDYLGCGFHLAPNIELPRLLGCAIERGFVRVDAAQTSSLPHVYCAGELTGIGGLEKALVEGEIAGLAAAGRPAAHLYKRRDRHVLFAQQLDTAFALRAELRDLATPETIVCRCEDVRRSTLENIRGWREAKLHTRCGMGPCQGRICGPATSFLFGWSNESVRPPLTPARMETLAGPLEHATAKTQP